MEKKYKSKFLFAVIGVVIGFMFHLNCHFKYNVQLFSFSPHVISGTLYTIIGIMIGLFIDYLLYRKRDNRI